MLEYENTFLGGGSGGAYLPSFDFELFDLPAFSPLQANEFGAETSFRANTPSGFADFSLDRLLGILRTPNPTPFPVRSFQNDFELENMFRFFQSGTGNLPQSRQEIEAEVERNKKVYEEAKGDYDKVLKQRTGCNLLDIVTFRCQPAIVTGTAKPSEPDKPMVSDGKGVLGTDSSKSIGAFFSSLPAGSGIFLLGIVAVIFLFLFVRR